MLAKLKTYSLLGIEALPVEVEVDVSPVALPKTVLVGLPEAAVKESTHRVERAIVNSGFLRPQDRIVINLAPAELPKQAATFDLPITLGILAGSGQIQSDLFEQYSVVGELALEGKTRPARGALSMAIAAARQEGLRGLVVPTSSAGEAAVVEKIDVIPPADILGSEILEEGENGRRDFRFLPGPVFCQLLMADEINRASPRTQSALLQAMQEHRVSVAGHYHELPKPFHVLATQNPLEQEGTYPLPEAQLDRFLMQIDVGYPDEDAERRMLIATTGAHQDTVSSVLTPEDLKAAQTLVRRIPVGESVVNAILSMVRNGRPDSSDLPEVQRNVAWGPGPRASQALMLASRARALLDGRLAPSVDDVLALAEPVLKHRMALNFAARADGVTIEDVIRRLTAPMA